MAKVMFRDAQPEMPERRLLAAVLTQAWHDAGGGDLHEAFSAFRWVVTRHPMFLAICSELGISPDVIATRFREEFGPKFRLVGNT